jgi:hypothetical protein
MQHEGSSHGSAKTSTFGLRKSLSDCAAVSKYTVQNTGQLSYIKCVNRNNSLVCHTVVSGTCSLHHYLKYYTRRLLCIILVFLEKLSLCFHFHIMPLISYARKITKNQVFSAHDSHFFNVMWTWMTKLLSVTRKHVLLRMSVYGSICHCEQLFSLIKNVTSRTRMHLNDNAWDGCKQIITEIKPDIERLLNKGDVKCLNDDRFVK